MKSATRPGHHRSGKCQPSARSRPLNRDQMSCTRTRDERGAIIGAAEAEIGDHGTRQRQGLYHLAIRRDLRNATIDQRRLTNPSIAVDFHRVEQRVARRTVEQLTRVKLAIRVCGDPAGTSRSQYQIRPTWVSAT
jgi:hypothetical protein